MKWTTELIHPEASLARARTMVGFGRYLLGAGGFHPSASDPQALHWDKAKHHRGIGVDCSGFLFWCWGVSRVQRLNGDKEHLDTDWLVRDARGNQRRVMLVAPEAIQPGDGIVYGDYKDRYGKPKQGHCGIITEPPPGGLGSKFNRMKVIHCSSGNGRAFGYAIAETNAKDFNSSKDTIFVRPLP